MTRPACQNAQIQRNAHRRTRPEPRAPDRRISRSVRTDDGCTLMCSSRWADFEGLWADLRAGVSGSGPVSADAPRKEAGAAARSGTQRDATRCVVIERRAVGFCCWAADF